MDQVARDVQAAHSAQEQAAKGNSEAAGQAAQSLQHAAQAMNDAPGQGHPGQGQEPPGQHDGAPKPGGSGNGVTLHSEPTGDPRPASVKDLGVSPSDWARLPPKMQQELLNASQQKGPPEYQDMIKNYYTRIARMQADGGVP